MAILMAMVMVMKRPAARARAKTQLYSGKHCFLAKTRFCPINDLEMVPLIHLPHYHHTVCWLGTKLFGGGGDCFTLVPRRRIVAMSMSCHVS